MGFLVLENVVELLFGLFAVFLFDGAVEGILVAEDEVKLEEKK